MISATRSGIASARRALVSLALIAATAVVLASGTAALAHPVRPIERPVGDMPRASATTPSTSAVVPGATATSSGAVISSTATESHASPPRPSGPAAPDSGSPAAAAVAIALLGAVAILVVAARHRRAIALGLVLVAGVLAFETGVHSVHHLGSPRDMSQCAVAVAVAHVQGAVDGPPAAPDRSEHVSPAPPLPEPVRLTTRAWHPCRGRAPPPPVLA